MKYSKVLLFLITAATGAIPYGFVKKYTQTRRLFWFILAIFAFIIYTFLLSIVLIDQDITIIYPVLKILSIIIVVISGILFFKSELDLKKIIGILFAMLSIFILSTDV
jgi:multidrug transporter EmrE-like cation transporter